MTQNFHRNSQFLFISGASSFFLFLKILNKFLEIGPILHCIFNEIALFLKLSVSKKKFDQNWQILEIRPMLNADGGARKGGCDSRNRIVEE